VRAHGAVWAAKSRSCGMTNKGQSSVPAWCIAKGFVLHWLHDPADCTVFLRPTFRARCVLREKLGFEARDVAGPPVYAMVARDNMPSTSAARAATAIRRNMRRNCWTRTVCRGCGCAVCGVCSKGVDFSRKSRTCLGAAGGLCEDSMGVCWRSKRMYSC